MKKKFGLGKILMLAGGIVISLGSVLPWWIGYNGLYWPGLKNGGFLTLTTGLVIVLMLYFWQEKHKAFFCSLIGILSLLSTIFIAYKGSEKWYTSIFHAAGIGFLLCFFGGIIGFVGAMIAFKQRDGAIPPVIPSDPIG